AFVALLCSPKVSAFITNQRILRSRQDNKFRIAATSVGLLSVDEEMATTQYLEDTTQPTVAPSLIVFDLDNTLWEPELFKLRRLERAKIQPVAGKDVTLFPAVQSILDNIRSSPHNWSKTKFAVASRTNKGDWARSLLTQFGLDELFSYVEIFPADKKAHFENLREKSGIPFEEMLFFDDNRDGKYGNCLPVSQMGVLSVHCPGGINTEEVWTNGLRQFQEWSSHKTPGTIVEWDGSLTTTSPPLRFRGVVQKINEERRYGFIRYGDRKTRDLFFHFNSLPKKFQPSIREGYELAFSVTYDSKKGKDAATDVEVVYPTEPPQVDTVSMQVFSMNLPFAALLANGYKTLETRNGTMFTPYPEGTKMLLHVGQRIYPDGDRHIDVMKSGGLSDEEIASFKSLPQGFGKGMAVAIVELGKTFETTLEERCDPDFQRKVGAFGADSGMRATEIKRVAYLQRGVRVSGQGGVFKADIERDVLPDGWL
ncbi:unnamed protein product, partial [Heterosigma akashiwo]